MSNDGDFEGRIVPFQALMKGRGPDTVVRFLTKELYTEIQCRVMEDKYWRQVEHAREKGHQPSQLLIQKLEALNRCETLDEFAYWLQDQSGRAMLVCNACGRVDVEEVLEIKENGERRRLCTSCCHSLGLLEIYSGAKALMPVDRVVRQKDPNIIDVEATVIDVEVDED